MEARFYCDLCVDPATSFCFCRSTKTKLCEGCFSKHSAKLPSSTHSRFPLAAFKFVESLSDLETFKARGEAVSKLASHLDLTESRLLQCLDQAQTAIDEEEVQLLTQVKLRMQAARQLVTDTGKKFAVEIRALKDQIQQTANVKDLDKQQLAQALVKDVEKGVRWLEGLKVQMEFRDQALMDSEFELYHLSMESVLECLSHSIHEEPEEVKSASSRLYTFNPYTPALGIFSPVEQSICLHNINSEFELFDLSSWVYLTSGQLLIAGGYSEKRGRCTRSVYLLDPYEASIQKLPPMRLNRRRPGLVEHQGSVYVFGGYREDYMKESERISLDQKTWSDVEDMIIGRSGVTPVVLEDKAYLAGDGSSLVEEYDFSTDSYHLLSFKLPFNSWVTAFSLASTLYFLQRNVLVQARKGASGLEKANQKTLDTKNWWYCQASPVTYLGKVYFPRYNEIWQFDPESLSLVKVNEFS